MRTPLNVLCGVALLLAALSAAAQQHPNIERGLLPDKSYQFGDVDTVNLFNGSVNVFIPIGMKYPVNAMSYQFGVSYATNGWSIGNHEVTEYYQHEPYEFSYTTHWSFPAKHANAGFGWMLTFGKLCCVNDYRQTYVSPDGAEHSFFDTLHENNEDETTYAGSAPNPLQVWYTRDGTYLRLRRYADRYELDFPDGDVHIFDTTGRLLSMTDPFGNAVSIAYGTRGSGDFASSTKWTVSDSTGRTHYVYFRPAPSYPESEVSIQVAHEIVDYLDLAAFDGRAEYHFHYDDDGLANEPSVLLSRRCPHSEPSLAESVRVAMLESIELPEGLSYAMEYDLGNQTSCSQMQFVDSSGTASGNIKKLRLTTGAEVRYDYRIYDYPIDNGYEWPFPGAGPYETTFFATVPGVAARRVVASDGVTILSETEYVPVRYDTVFPEQAQQRILRRKSGDAVVQEERHYFSVCVANTCGSGSVLEYGLPYTRVDMPPGGPFLSVETLTPGTGNVVRKTLVAYEGDGDLNAPYFLDPQRKVNQRLRYMRTEYEDGTYSDRTLSLFDGLGHYRQAVTGGTNPNGANVRTTVVNYNPSRGTFNIGPDGTFTGDFTMVPVSSRWILGTYDSESATEDGQTSATAACFDANGFLTGRRTYASFGEAPSRQGKDLLAIFTPDTHGNVAMEQYLGGDDIDPDVEPSEVEAPTTQTCLSSSASDNYRILHTFESGVRKSSYFVDSGGQPLSYFLVDTEIDAGSGLVKTRRDASNVGANGVSLANGLEWNLEYDLLGRLVLEKPATTTNRAGRRRIAFSANSTRVDLFEENAAGTTELRQRALQLDGLGRVLEETRSIPGGFSAARTWEYDGLGRITALSVWGNQAPPVMTRYEYDLFSRLTKQTLPDGSKTTWSYKCALDKDCDSRILMTTDVRTASGPTNAVTTSTYDGQGRLRRVTEPSGTITRYGYDVANRLTHVCADETSGCAQNRYFNYDNRGFLASEQHPETGVSGNETTHYRYDSRGNVVRRWTGAQFGDFDVHMEYDRGGRLKRLFEAKTTDGIHRDLKLFKYGISNTSSEFSNGKMTRAVRHNWLESVGIDVQIVEDYIYEGREGAVSSRRTYDSECQNNAAVCNPLFAGAEKRDFTQSFLYDELGNATTVQYPACTTPGVAPCTAGSNIPARTVTNTYDRGWLTSIDWTTAPRPATIEYHDNGMVKQITHANLVLDQILLDSAGIPRPFELKTTNVVDSADCVIPAFVTQPQSSTIERGSSATLSARAVADDAYPPSYQWYRGTYPDRSTSLVETERLADGTSTYTATGLTASTSYWVEATNGCPGGAVASSTAVVTVCQIPLIGTDPQNADITRSQSVTLSVAASGTGPFSYQWYTVVSIWSSIPINGATASELVVTPNQTTKYRVKVSNACGSADSAVAEVVVHEPPAAPVTVTASSNGATNTVTWSASASDFGIASYDVQRHDGVVLPVTAPALTTNDASVVANTAYLYRVRGVDSHGVAGPWSAYDLATTVTFTDDPIVAGVIAMKGSHIAEIRQAIDAVRARASLSPGWPSYAFANGPVYASHVVEMRGRLNEARAVLGLPALVYSDPNLSPSQSVARAASVQELRNGVK